MRCNCSVPSGLRGAGHSLNIPAMLGRSGSAPFAAVLGRSGSTPFAPVLGRSRLNGRLGAIQMPANCDAQLVTRTVYKDDGTTGVFVGDYELTQADFGNINAWRNACIAEKQAAQDAAAAALALQQAAAPITVSQFTMGPGAPATTSLHYSVQLAQQIQDPVVKQNTLNQIQTLTNQNNPGANIQIPGAGYVAPNGGGFVTADPGSTFAPGEHAPGGGAGGALDGKTLGLLALGLMALSGGF